MQRAKGKPGIAEAGCILVLLFFAMQGAIPGIAPNQAAEMTNAAATSWMKIAGIGSQLIVDGWIAALVVHQCRRLYRLRFALQWSAVFAAWAALSSLWSQDPVTTARRSIAFVLACLFGLYFAARFPVRKQLFLFCMTMLVAALASSILAWRVPSIGLEASTGHFGNWQGIFTQKNACGRAMVFAIAAIFSFGRLNVTRLGCLLLFTAVLIMSGSRGAWAIAAVVLGLYVFLMLLFRSAPSARAMLLGVSIVLAVATAWAAWVYFPLLVALMGRDATLTGRTAIWQQVWEAILRHPWLGYGFSAFWQGLKGESFYVILALRFVLFHAHNGFLEIWLELGLPGLFFFLLSYLRGWKKLWPLLLRRRLQECAWMLFVLVLVFLYDLDENTLLTFNGMFWVLYVAALANIEILASEERLLKQRQKFFLRLHVRMAQAG
jgi:exopolysaccharide production protein ExoQ